MEAKYSDDRLERPAELTGRLDVVAFSLTEGDELRDVLPLANDNPDLESERNPVLLLL